MELIPDLGMGAKHGDPARHDIVLRPMYAISTCRDRLGQLK